MREAAEYIIGNLNEDGYLIATDDELLAGYLREQMEPEAADNSQRARELSARMADLPPEMAERARGHLTAAMDVVRQLDPLGVGTRDLRECLLVQVEAQRKEFDLIFRRSLNGAGGSAAAHDQSQRRARERDACA